MNNNQISILLELLDLEYLKPILINRFHNIDDLISVNLNEIGIQNQDDISKLRYVLDKLQNNQNSLEQYDPILSIKDSSQIITRIENEANLISSSLNFLLNKNRNVPKDDATSDIDYNLYNCRIDQIDTDIKQLQKTTEDLDEQIQIEFPYLQQSLNEYQTNKINQYSKRTLIIVTVSVLCIGLMFYIKQK